MCQHCMWQMVAWELQQEAPCLLLYVQGTRFQNKHFRMLTTQTHFQTQKPCISYHSVREAFVLSHKAAVSWHCWITIFSWPSLNFGRELAICCMRIFSSSNPSRSLSSLSNDFFLEYGIKKNVWANCWCSWFNKKHEKCQDCAFIVLMRLMIKLKIPTTKEFLNNKYRNLFLHYRDQTVSCITRILFGILIK